MVDTWLPRKRLAVRPTTAYRYAWIVHHHIIPTVGVIALRDLRSDHVDHLYAQLMTVGGCYQHVLPDMGARAAADFAELLRGEDSGRRLPAVTRV